MCLVIAVIAGCGPSPYQKTKVQAEAIVASYDRCIAGLKITQADRSLHKFLFPALSDIGFHQKTDDRWPTDDDITQMKPLISKRLGCERSLLSNMNRVSRLNSSYKSQLQGLISVTERRARSLENASAGLVLGKYSYGEYFTRYESALSSAKTTVNNLRTQSSQQQPSAPAPTFKPYCPPSKYPIYGCGNTSSSPSSSNRNPPGSKECTYKSGLYKWTKTIKGYTCPATDNSGGYFGTLVR